MKKLTLTNLKNYTKEELNNIIADDEQLTTDIELSVVNEYKYSLMLEQLQTNYSRKIKKDAFNYALAVKGVLNIVDSYIKEIYIKNYCNSLTTIKNLITVNDRIFISRNLLDDILADMEEL